MWPSLIAPALPLLQTTNKRTNTPKTPPERFVLKWDVQESSRDWIPWILVRASQKIRSPAVITEAKDHTSKLRLWVLVQGRISGQNSGRNYVKCPFLLFHLNDVIPVKKRKRKTVISRSISFSHLLAGVRK